MQTAGSHADGQPFTRLALLTPLLLAGCTIIVLPSSMRDPNLLTTPSLWALGIAAGLLHWVQVDIGSHESWKWGFHTVGLVTGVLVLGQGSIVWLLCISAVIAAVGVQGCTMNRVRYGFTELFGGVPFALCAIWAIGVSSSPGVAWLVAVIVGGVIGQTFIDIASFWIPGPGLFKFQYRALFLPNLVVTPAVVLMVVGFESNPVSVLLMLALFPLAGLVLNKIGERARVEEELAMTQRMLNTDPVTGLLTREALFEGALSMITDARRRDEPVALAMGDLDDFKRLNDSAGHLAGDHALSVTGRAMDTAAAASSDMLAGRYGGEEFAIVVVGARAEAFEVLLHALRKQIASDLEEDGVTISFGHATLYPDELLGMTSTRLRRRRSHEGAQPTADLTEQLMAATTALETLVERADQAMYEAKRSGKNRVVTWTPGTDEHEALAA